MCITLFQYQYNSSQASGIIQTLVRLTINTVDAQLHRCKKLDEVFGPASPFVPRNRSRGKLNLAIRRGHPMIKSLIFCPSVIQILDFETLSGAYQNLRFILEMPHQTVFKRHKLIN